MPKKIPKPFDERQKLVNGMTNWQRHQFRKATRRGKPLPIEAVRAIAATPRRAP